ncbi:hypothetical protein T4E_7558, partial [Trichinella pseudospiralis]
LEFPGTPVRNPQPSLFQERPTTYRRHVDSSTVCPVVYDPLPSPSTIAYHHQLAAQYRLNFRADTPHLWTNNAGQSNFTTAVYHQHHHHQQQQQQQQQQHSQSLRQCLTDDLISPLPSVVLQEPIVPLEQTAAGFWSMQARYASNKKQQTGPCVPPCSGAHCDGN